MNFSEYGYGTWKFNADAIQKRLDRVLDAIYEIRQSGIRFDALCVTGTSGTWLAPLLIMKGYNVVLIRKDEERSHGQKWEGAGNTEVSRLVLVDDLIRSGNTVRRVIESLKEEYVLRSTYSSQPPAEGKLVAIILHDQMESSSHRGIPVFGYNV
jgi:orotate phosphoribosyltransferase-like protein